MSLESVKSFLNFGLLTQAFYTRSQLISFYYLWDTACACVIEKFLRKYYSVGWTVDTFDNAFCCWIFFVFLSSYPSHFHCINHSCCRYNSKFRAKFSSTYHTCIFLVGDRCFFLLKQLCFLLFSNYFFLALNSQILFLVYTRNTKKKVLFGWKLKHLSLWGKFYLV